MESSFKLTSSAFKQGDHIPPTYSYKGENHSPPLAWSGVPVGTKSFVLINDDPDAPMGCWTHWVVWNIPGDATSLAEGVGVKGTKILKETRQGITDFGFAGYGGPAPPSGEHHYYFKLYALKDSLKLPSGSGKVKVEAAIKDLIIGKAELMGLYAAK